VLALGLATVGVLVVSTFASAFGGGWAPPRRVFTADTVPSHDMTTDASGYVHIASDRGSAGIWYITNAGGAWAECRVSDGDDHRPSIAVEGDVVHVAFARTSGGAPGLYTASGAAAVSGPDCGWPLTLRYAGSASHPSLQERGGILSIAFRTGDRKLRFIRGAAGVEGWAAPEVIDGSCCTSPVALALTDGGSPRVAYGDGAGTAQGLKFAVRTSSGWRASKAHGGRIKHVALVLDQMPGLFGEPPSNAPRVAYVVARRGAYLGTKASGGVTGAWTTRSLAKAYGPLDLTYASNITYIVYTKGGDLRYARASGGIWVGGLLSGSGRDGQPQLAGGSLTFTRKGTPSGIYVTH
jgi:hypothetical protein